MLRKIFFALLLALSFPTFAVMADQAYINIEQRLSIVQLRETGLDTLTLEQMTRLNQILRDETAKQVKTEKTQAEKKIDAPSYIGLDDKPIKSRVLGTVSGWDIDTVFELENGQKWKVLKGRMSLRKPMNSPNIVVVPGIAGRWFLQVDEDLPKARVYRID